MIPANDLVTEKNRHLVKKIYDGALNPSDFNDVFRAWDDYFLAIGTADARKHSEDFAWMEEIVSHFETAGAFVDKLYRERELPLEQRIRALPCAAMVCDLAGRILAFNDRAAAQFGLDEDRRADALDFLHDAASRTALNALGHDANAAEDGSGARRMIAKLYPANSDEAQVFLADRTDTLNPATGLREPRLLLRSLTASWSEEVVEALRTAYALTTAELALVENLYKGLTIREISDRTKRSQGTLRTQLHAILTKTDTRGQADLLRIVAGLVQVLQRDDTLAARARLVPVNRAFQRRHTVALDDGMRVELVESGDLDGIPVYFLMTSSTPLLNADLVNALKQAGIRLIAPMRSGVGETTHLPLSEGPEVWAAHHAAVLDRLGARPALVGGHRCGGVYALELAARLGAAAVPVLLADTGAPMTRLSMFHEMPTAPKRLFLAARCFPPAIRTPYKMVAADFFRSPRGEDRAVSYFYEGSPADQKIYTQRKYWQATRDNIEYCFLNPMQTAQDVVHWSRDFSPVLTRVLQQTRVHFLHGAENTVRRAAHVETLSQAQNNASCDTVPERGQLLIYAEPERFAQSLRQLADQATVPIA